MSWELRISQTLHSPAELKDFIQKVDSKIGARSLVALSGALGAGKTTLVRHWVSFLGKTPEAVASPTFAFCHEYQVSEECRVFHWDLYRADSQDELESLGFWDQLIDNSKSSGRTLVFVEWPERLADFVPGPEWNFLKIEMASEPDTASSTRTIKFFEFKKP